MLNLSKKRVNSGTAFRVSSGKLLNGQVFQLMKSSKHQFRYAIRRLQKAQNNLQRDKFMTKILKGGSGIFDEIKKFRGHSKKCSSTIDGEVGSTNIANLFANIYIKTFIIRMVSQSRLKIYQQQLKNVSPRKIYLNLEGLMSQLSDKV